MLLHLTLAVEYNLLSPCDSMFVQCLNFFLVFFMFVPLGAVGPGATQGIVNLNSGTDVEAGDEFIFFSLPLKQRPILAISVGAHVV